MAALTAIREAIAANLTANLASGCQVSAYLVSSPVPPVLDVYPSLDQPIVYDRAMGRGQDDWRVTVRGRVALNMDEGAQRLLDKWLASSGTDSVKAAVEADPTLGGACSDLRVEECRAYQVFEDAGTAFLGAEWQVLVLARG